MTFIEDSYFNYLDWFLISSRFFWWFSFNSIFQTDIFSKLFSFELFKFPSFLAFFLISRKCLFPAINVNESPWKTSSTKADSNEYYPKNFIKSWRYFSSKGLESFLKVRTAPSIRFTTLYLVSLQQFYNLLFLPLDTKFFKLFIGRFLLCKNIVSYITNFFTNQFCNSNSWVLT